LIIGERQGFGKLDLKEVTRDFRNIPKATGSLRGIVEGCSSAEEKELRTGYQIPFGM